MAISSYAGAKRRVLEDELPLYQARGWVATEKIDGAYAEIHVGSTWVEAAPAAGPAYKTDHRTLDHRFRHNRRVHGALIGAIYRSGRQVQLTDLAGLELGMPDGTVLVGEVHQFTPASLRWVEAHGGLGFTLFDVLQVGDEDLRSTPYAKRRATLEWLCGGLPERAGTRLSLATQVDRGLRAFYRGVLDGGGEGVVLCDPSAPVGKGKLKVKRRDTLDARVIQLLPDERCMLVDWGGVSFHLALPSFPVVIGDVVEVASMGFYDSNIPRHARALRVRRDLV